MDAHHEFTEWVKDRGVQINGIAAHRFEGRGIGIVAEKDLEAGDLILITPTFTLHTASTVPKSLRKALPKIAVHGLLAAELSLNISSTLAPWRAVLPTSQDFADSIPLLWDASLQALLPAASQKLLMNQKYKLSKDWAAVHKAFPDINYDEYIYNWLVINTRTFYFTTPKTPKRTNHDDCMALNPFADYFNHAATGCEVLFTEKGYTITTNRAYKMSEEVYISYGNHSNDFLLAEYGFILESNMWDEISLDTFILPKLSEIQKKHLKDSGFLGNYVLDRETVCHRTQVALRILCLPFRRWERFVNGRDDGQKDEADVNELLHEVLESHLKEAATALSSLNNLGSELASQREALTRRWKQIELLLQAAIQRIEE